MRILCIAASIKREDGEEQPCRTAVSPSAKSRPCRDLVHFGFVGLGEKQETINELGQQVAFLPLEKTKRFFLTEHCCAASRRHLSPSREKLLPNGFPFMTFSSFRLLFKMQHKQTRGRNGKTSRMNVDPTG